MVVMRLRSRRISRASGRAVGLALLLTLMSCASGGDGVAEPTTGSTTPPSARRVTGERSTEPAVHIGRPTPQPPSLEGLDSPPPPAWVETPRGTEWMAFGSYCWGTECADMRMPVAEELPTVRVREGEQLVFHLGFEPDALYLRVFTDDGQEQRPPVQLPAQRTVTWRAGGQGILDLFATGQAGGDASYQVWLQTAASESSQRYRITPAAVLESPEHGPQLCFGFEASYPPQCGGADIDGWDWDGVVGEESADGTTWIHDVVLTGTWDGETFTLTGPVQAAPPRSEKDPGLSSFTPGCDEPDVVDPTSGLADSEDALAGIAQDRLSAVWVSDRSSGWWDGPSTLTVVVPPGQGEGVQRDIRERYAGPLCVVEREQPTLGELEAVQQEVLLGQGTALGDVFSRSIDDQRGVVVVMVMVADEQAREAAQQRWGGLVQLRGRLQPVP